MARPKQKSDLLDQSTAEYQRLLNWIDDLPPESQTAEFPPGTMNRNIRDILGHLHHWHLMMLEWYHVGMSGQKPEIPAPGFTWKTTPELNRKIWETCQEFSLEETRARFEKTHAAVHQLIGQHSQEELFQKKRYPWTGSTSLGAYLISATCSHYGWGLKLMKKAMKAGT